ncbi:MAG: hypothetical protein E7Z87_02195 [Cyanobacteria bacterium SIG26]|nr:hypothetical protein [Cyanobacteria bacterium SIG26]
MQIQRIHSTIGFNNKPEQANQQAQQKPEFIDKLMARVKNQRDINDCVAVPRGIFKAYLWIMGGFGLLGISSAIPTKLNPLKKTLIITGNIMNIISAFYFAKPFAFKGASPTVEKN